MERAGTRRLIGVVAIGALLLAACGDDSTTEAKGFRVSTMARSMEEAGTARIAGTVTVDATDHDSSLRIEGAVDFANDRSSTEVWENGAKGDEPLTRAISIGGVGYTADSSDLREGIGPATKDTPWVRSESVPAAGPVELTGLGDVSHVFDVLERAGWDGERVGDDEVQGESTVHYRYTLSDPRLDVPLQVQVLDSGSPETQSIDLWADSSSRLRRLTQDLEGADYRIVVDVELSDFGEPVAIEAPPSDQVVVDDWYETTAEWKLVASGRDGGDAWRVFHVPMRNGECFAHETEPHTETGDLGVNLVGRVPDQCSRSYGGGSSEFDEALETTVAVTLPSGRALLYGEVSRAVRGLTLEFGNGRTERVTLTEGVFGVTMAADEVVQAIRVERSAGESVCPLDPDGFGYSCSLEPEGPPATGLPGPSAPGVVNTAPPGA